MQSEPLFELPTRVTNVLNRASNAGWVMRTTYAEVEGSRTVCVRFLHAENNRRCYALWYHSVSEKTGKDSVTWGHGSSADMHYFGTLAALQGYLFGYQTKDTADAPA